MFKELYQKDAELLKQCYGNIDETSFIKNIENIYHKLSEINEYLNLTRITSKEAFWEKHIVDSLIIGKALPQFFKKTDRLADVGCGGGFPCLPLAAINPSMTIRGIESIGKKVKAVNEIAQFCQFDNLEIIKFRGAEAAKQADYHKSFDAVTARAVATGGVLIRECRNLIHDKGVIILYKTPQAIEKEKKEILREAKRYNMNVRYSAKFKLSEESGERQFVIIQYK